MMSACALVPLVISAIVLMNISFSVGHCIKSESKALLEFKRGLADDSDLLASWNHKADCCSWFGVICDNFTGHVIELHLQGDYDEGSIIRGNNISESLQEIKHLKYLDLSNNEFWEIPIPDFFGYMSSLRFLNLSKAGFEGKIPSSIGNLTSLNTLDLSINYFVGEIPHQLGNLSNLQYLSVRQYFLSSIHVDKLGWVSRLSSLSFVDLSNVNLYTALDWAESLGKLPSLQHLHLSGCQLTQIPPNLNVNFSSLAVLDLSGNWFKFKIPKNLFGGLTKLKLLDLSYNNFVGHIPSSIGNLTSVNTLVLSFNNFVGKIPMSFKSLCNLKLLSLYSTQLSQEINVLIEILSFCVSEKLESLDLSYSHFSGHLSNHLKLFKSLVSLDLSYNSITGPLPISFGEMTSLTFLDLSHNNLSGILPSSFGMLGKLVRFDVSFSSLEGEVSEIHFKNLHNLQEFVADENHLIWKVNPEWIPPFQLVRVLNLRSCEVGPQFPNWLRHLKYLQHLVLSNSNICSRFPHWVLNFSTSLSNLDLSHNHMYGLISNLSSGIHYIDLSSNHLEGPLPYMANLGLINLSNNLLSGSIHNLCYSYSSIVILKENHLNGEIPNNCWMDSDWTFLEILELSSNNFSGNIPTSIGNLSSLQLLSLRNNSLTGEIPSNLQNCKDLVVIDLGENELSGEIPSWIGEHFSKLKILNIRGNNFHGHMSKELCNLTNLQILDFADNNLNGTIPACVGNFMGMSGSFSSGSITLYVKSDRSYVGSSSIMRNRKMVEYNTTLGFVKNFDFSNNSLVGEIPARITNLSGLQSLNLSYNFLTGRIPKDIDAMQKLEILDLSRNRLFGEIPWSMSSMNFLSNLNLSYNNLSGQIPTGTQLQSMDPSSFTGNKLCGPPLTNDCNNKEATPSNNTKGREDDGSETGAVDWFYFYVSLAPGFAVGFWCVVGPLAFNMRWRRVYYDSLDLLWGKIWVWFHVHIVRILRR